MLGEIVNVLLTVGGAALILSAAKLVGIDITSLFGEGKSADNTPPAPPPNTPISGGLDDFSQLPEIDFDAIFGTPIGNDNPPLNLGGVETVAGFGTFSQAEWMARTIFGEARGEPAQGMRAVGHVIMNRVNDRGFPDSVAKVVTQGNGSQFQAWRVGDPNRDRLLSVTSSDEMFALALSISQEILAGQSFDPTNGAIIYFNPATSTNSSFVNAVLSQVDSGQAIQIDIGRHAFFQGAR